MPDVVLRTRATILVTVTDGKAVTKVTILPDLGDAGNLSSDADLRQWICDESTAEDVATAIEFADENMWEPLFGLPDDVVWEG